jgi:hypothetical protein
MEPKLESVKSEHASIPVHEQWEHWNNVLPKSDMSNPIPVANDLEEEIRQAQAQLAQLKKQRELIDIQQKVAEERNKLEQARSRLLATTNETKIISSFTPTTPASTPSRDSNPNNNAHTEGPQKKPCLARIEPPTAPSHHHDRRSADPQTPRPTQPKQLQAKPASAQGKPAQAKPPQPKPTPKVTKNNISSLSLEELRALAAASRSPAAPKAEMVESTQSPVRAFNPPTQPASHASAPPVPNVAVYNGRSLGEFKNYTIGLDRHFDKYSDWYRDEENKVTRALKHITLTLEDDWKRHILNQSPDQNTYAKLRTFLIHQINKGCNPGTAKQRYLDSFQRDGQSVADFSNWMQQWEPHFKNDFSERDRMRHIFEHLKTRVRNEADKTYLDFTNYDDFVDYLVRVEESVERGGRDSNPRKRSRHD